MYRMLGTYTTNGGNVAFSRKCIVTLAVGVTFGFSFAYVLLNVVAWEKTDMFGHSFVRLVAAHPQGGHHDPHSHEELEDATGPVSPVSFHGSDEEFHRGMFFNFFSQKYLELRKKFFKKFNVC